MNLGDRHAATLTPTGSIFFTVMAARAHTVHEITPEQIVDSVTHLQPRGGACLLSPNAVSETSFGLTPNVRTVRPARCTVH